jgi:hypothetical protein
MPPVSSAIRLGGGTVGFRHTRLTFLQTPECFTGSVDVRHTAQPTALSGETSMSKATKPVLTYAQFAHDIGAHSRLTLEVSLVWHKQWLKATPQTRTAMRDEFMTHFTMGLLKCAMPQAVRILTATISQRTKVQHNAYMAASQKFKHHISRDSKKTESKPVKSKRMSADVRAAAKAYLAQFDNVTDAIAALKAVAPKK